MKSPRIAVLPTMLLAIITMTGCTAGGRDFQTVSELKSGQAVIYVYRPHTMDFIADPDVPIVYLNDERVGRIRINGHFSMNVDAGTHNVTVRSSMLGIPIVKVGEIQLEAEPSHSYYMRLVSKFQVLGPFPISGKAPQGFEFVEVSEDVGLSEIQRTKHIGSN